MLARAALAAKYAAQLLGRVTYAANHFPSTIVQEDGSTTHTILRDSQSAPIGRKRKQALEHAQDAWCYYAYFGLMRQKKGDDEQSRAHRVPLVCILAKHFIHEFLFEPSATIAPLYEAVRETKDLPVVDLFRFDVPKTETDTYHAHCGSDQDKRRARRCLSMGMCG